MNVSLLENILSNFFITVSVVYLGTFQLGQINEIKQNHMIISLFQYKLDRKTAHISPQDILLNFGGNGGKSTFVLSEKRQRALVNKIIEIGLP